MNLDTLGDRAGRPQQHVIAIAVIGESNKATARSGPRRSGACPGVGNLNRGCLPRHTFLAGTTMMGGR